MKPDLSKDDLYKIYARYMEDFAVLKSVLYEDKQFKSIQEKYQEDTLVRGFIDGIGETYVTTSVKFVGEPRKFYSYDIRLKDVIDRRPDSREDKIKKLYTWLNCNQNCTQEELKLFIGELGL